MIRPFVIMLALAALVLSFQGKSLVSGIAPKLTGRNGYEEYLQAADILKSPEEGVYASWRPGAKPPNRDVNDPEDKGPSKVIVDLYAHLQHLTPLEVRREELQRFGKALALVAQGNSKPVFDPRTSIDAGMAFPELAAFRYVTRFASRAATVYAADGQTGRAVEVLVDQLTFADNIGRGVIISNLVGTASAAITLSAFSDLLPRLNRVDALRVEHAVESLLARPASARAVLPAEIAFTKSALREAFAMKGDASTLFTDGDEKTSAHEKALVDEFTTMTPASREALLRKIEARLDAQANAMDRVLAGPEKKWASGLSALTVGDDENPADLGEAFISMLSPAYSGFAAAAARSRTQLRLLELHAKLIEFRWEYGHLPEAVDAIDPLSGERYIYEKRADGTVRLASKGIAETGEIELRYRRQATEEPQAKP